MKSRKGFTLIELMIVVGILAILSATAIPLLKIYQQRAYGSEANVMLKRILDAEILYFLETENFFPNNVGDTILVADNDPNTKLEIGLVLNALNLTIPVGHALDFTIQRMPDGCLVTISSAGNRFELFKGGAVAVMGYLYETGKIDIDFI